MTKLVILESGKLVDQKKPPSWAVVPIIVSQEGESATRRFIEFFTANIRNLNTREAYGRAIHRFFNWCDSRNLSLESISPSHVAGYIENHDCSAPTVKQHLAAIRMLFDWLVVGQIAPFNPASSVRGPKHVVKRGKTPVLDGADARTLIEAIDITTPVGLRDRALIGVMIYSFARVGAAVGMSIGDYYPNGKRYWLRFLEKGGKFHEVPAHHKIEEYLDEYIESLGSRKEDKKAPLFRTALGKTGVLSDRQMTRNDALRMIKRRAKDVEFSEVMVCCHTFRATGITSYLENGGTIENAQAIAAHESPRTTKLYDRTNDQIVLEEVERIRI